MPDSIRFMGTGAPQAANWTSPRIYAYLFQTLTPTGSAATGTLKLATYAQAQRFILASGFICKDPADKVDLEPWYDFEDSDPFQREKGAYSIEAWDQDGKVLASQGFNVSFFAKTNPPTDLAKAPLTSRPMTGWWKTSSCARAYHCPPAGPGQGAMRLHRAGFAADVAADGVLVRET